MPGRIKIRIKHLKEGVLRVVHDKPGRRFENYHNRKQQSLQEHPVKKVSIYIIGFVLISAGFLFGFVPGAPGFFLGIPGLALIAARSKYLARLMDRGETAIRKLIRKVKK